MTSVRRAFLLAATAMLLTQQVLAGPWLKSLGAAQKKAKQENHLIFVDLFADWCGWCHKMEQEVFPSEAFQKATDDKVLLRLNTEDGGEGTKLSQRFSVTTLPTFLLLTPDLTLAGIIHGYWPSGPFVENMSEVLTKYQDFKKRVADEASITNDYQKRLDLAKEFRERFALGEAEVRFRKLISDSAAPSGVRDEAYYELALTQVLERKYDDSLKTIRKFATVQNKGDAYEKSRLLAGNIYVQQGNFLGAVNEFHAFKTAFPQSPYITSVNAVLPELEKRLASRVQ